MDEMLFHGGYEKKMQMKFSCSSFRSKGEFNCLCPSAQVCNVQVLAHIDLHPHRAVVTDHPTPAPAVGDQGIGQSLPYHSRVPRGYILGLLGQPDMIICPTTFHILVADICKCSCWYCIGESFITQAVEIFLVGFQIKVSQ